MYICLDTTRKFHTIWTTNFDDLVEKAINFTDGSCSVISTKDSNSLSNIRNDIPKVVKLHGDFRYDKLQNTDSELQNLEISLHKQFVTNFQQKGLIVVGYSGYDKSVLKSLWEVIHGKNPFPRGLIWCLPKGQFPSSQLTSLIEQANNKNQRSGFLFIDSFDYFLHELYSISDVKNESIDSLAKVKFEQKKPFKTMHPSTKSAYIAKCNIGRFFPK